MIKFHGFWLCSCCAQIIYDNRPDEELKKEYIVECGYCDMEMEYRPIHERTAV